MTAIAASTTPTTGVELQGLLVGARPTAVQDYLRGLLEDPTAVFGSVQPAPEVLERFRTSVNDLKSLINTAALVSSHQAGLLFEWVRPGSQLNFNMLLMALMVNSAQDASSGPAPGSIPTAQYLDHLLKTRNCMTPPEGGHYSTEALEGYRRNLLDLRDFVNPDSVIHPGQQEFIRNWASPGSRLNFNRALVLAYLNGCRG